MSKTNITRHDNKDLRWLLLVTVSTTALLAYTYGAGEAKAASDDSDRPLLWIELGGQLERLNGGQVPFAPPYFDALVNYGFVSPLKAGKSAIYSDGFEGAISFSPQGSDWVFSGSIRYGRALGDKAYHRQKTAITHFSLSILPPTSRNHFTKTAAPSFEEVTNRNSEIHLITDFQAGKDVGLGLFGSESVSTVGVGLRFAQFNEKSNTSIHARTGAAGFFPYSLYGFIKLPLDNNYHNHFDTVQRAANFKGVGPSISWNASTPVAGNSQDGELVLDWGANAAVLFGRQKAKMHHHSSASYRYYKGKYRYLTYSPTRNAASDRSRSVVVPNIGGLASVSYRIEDFKVSFGYRADFFFGAIDGGFAARKSENRGFYGPFASVSVGIGD